MHLSKIFPIPHGNRVGVIIAVFLFILQLAYFHMQSTWLHEWVVSWFGIQSLINRDVTFLGITFTHATSLIGLINIFVHAGLSILIVWQLYQDPFNTRFVIILSLVLIGLYLGLYIAGKFSSILVLQIMSTKIRYFLASPLKTIFSIPALKVRDTEENIAEEDKEDEIKSEKEPVSLEM